MPKAAAPTSSFAGFPRSAPQFFHELQAEMSREWFTANKERYQTEWVTPMTALLLQVTPPLARAYRPVRLGEPTVMRIHRDVRFAKDKSPYKTHIAGVVTVAGQKLGEGGIAALYVHLGVDEELIGAGCYQFDRDRLARWRRAVAGTAGAALAKLMADLRRAGYEVGGHDDYKRVPAGFDPEHPRADLLKLKGLTGALPSIPRGLLHKAGLADWIAGHAAALAPLVKWLHKQVG